MGGLNAQASLHCQSPAVGVIYGTHQIGSHDDFPPTLSPSRTSFAKNGGNLSRLILEPKCILQLRPEVLLSWNCSWLSQ
jgi:hypothetical protein